MTGRIAKSWNRRSEDLELRLRGYARANGFFEESGGPQRFSDARLAEMIRALLLFRTGVISHETPRESTSEPEALGRSAGRKALSAGVAPERGLKEAKSLHRALERLVLKSERSPEDCCEILGVIHRFFDRFERGYTAGWLEAAREGGATPGPTGAGGFQENDRIAHDFNKVLASVVDCAEMLSYELDAGDLPERNGRILLVDDDELQAALGKRMLQSLGYTVEIYTDPLEALRAFREASKTFDLVITDLTMPRMWGDRLAAEIRGMAPQVPIILYSGFSAALHQARIQGSGIQRVLSKPLSKAGLACAVREVLGRNACAAGPGS